jgi:hypothetical protein
VTVVDHLFNRDPAPKLGKPARAWQGVTNRKGQTKDQREHPWQYSCPAPMCFYTVTAKTEKDILRVESDHTTKSDSCPWFGGGTTTLSWSIMAASFIEPIWKLLDECMDFIMQPGNSDDDPVYAETRLKRQSEARAYANTLAVLMPPFFTHPDQIAKEAKRRWNVRQSDTFDPERSTVCYATPGIGHLRYKPAETTKVMETTQVLQRPNAIQQLKALDQATTTAIKGALGSGMFTVKQLAATYGLTEAQVKAL